MNFRHFVCHRLLVLLFLFLVGQHSFGQKGTAKSKPDSSVSQPAVIKARNVVELRKRVGSQVDVVGRVSRAVRSSSGHQFLNFQSSELSVVCFKDYARNFTKGQPSDLYKGKDVEVSGTLELYKGKLQIKLMTPNQIRLADSVEATQPKSVPVEKYLKKIGKESWISPAGLKYTGRDPNGLTRVAHVLRHARDIPTRRGSHGVFDGGDGKTFQVIDEAWRLASKRKTQATDEGDRSTYTINMGRRIGYLGGTNGKRRRNPPLNRVFIVTRSGTREVVTAFPK